MFAEDARKFISAFQKPITESASHIYLSAFPFSPSTSMVSRQYKTQFPRTLHVLDGRQRYWPAELNTLQGHDNIVSSVAFSSDGKHIASGSQDKTIRVWDAETGQIVSGPFTGHDHSVPSLTSSHIEKH